MSQKTITTDPPRIDEDNFEDYLVTDQIFVDFFNTFLGLPSFPEPLRFNTETGGFEVLTSAKYEIADKIKAAVKARSTPRPQTAAVRFHAMDEKEEEEIKTSFSVKCLDKEQGIQWIKEERLPSFLHSELYSEYRMAKLLSQVETSPGGMKLTIDPDYRKWYKPKEVPPPPVVVDETEEMIKKMYVTLGSTTTSQTKEWFTEAKKVQKESTKLVSSKRSNVTVTRGPWARPRSSSRPTSVDSSRLDLAGDSTIYLLGDSVETCEKKKTAKRSVHFEQVTFSESQRHSGTERNLQHPDIGVTQPSKVDISVHSVSETSSTIFSKVARMEPEVSDDDSDQGMGSECLSSIEEDIVGSSDIMSKDQDDEAELELNNIDDYASTCVALSLKNVIISMYPNIEDSDLDNMRIFHDLLPKPKDFILGLRHSKKPFPISKLNEKTLAQAIVMQENRVLKESGSLSRASRSYGRTTKTDTLSIGQSDDILDLLKLPRKPLEFNEETGYFESRTVSSVCSDSDGYDSIFSEQSEEPEHRNRKKSPRYDEMDYNGFKKFKEFVHETMGHNIMLLWMDIDKIRFSLNETEIPQFVAKTRQKYLAASSTQHISKELLKKWNLEHASFWSKRKLKKTQRLIVESLLLYWAPRFLIHHSTRPVRLFNSPGIPNQQSLLNREKRPLSTQSYPSKKTAIIKPLRPKSCLPKLTEKKQRDGSGRSKKQYHEMGMYQKLTYHPKYQQPMYHALEFKPYKMETKEPKSLFPPTMEAIPPVLRSLQMSKDRPASARPATMGTLAIIERKMRSKSAKIGSASFPMGHSIPKEMKIPQRKNRRTSNSSETSILSGSSVSTILGSEPMESMLQALYHDTRAGLFFTRFCEQSRNKEWSSAIHFWFDAQEFHALFYRDAMDAYIVQRKAQAIHSNYIVVGAAEQIGLTKQQRQKVTKSLDPAFDELFDIVEEFVLRLLIVPWNQMLSADQDRYRKVELIEQERIVRVAAKYARVLQMKDNVDKKQNVAGAAQGDEKYEEDLRSKVPEEFRDFSFNDLIRNRIELEHFKKFLEENYAKTDLQCWLDIESFKRLPHGASEKRDEKAKDIKSKYLHKKYFFGTSSPATREQQTKVVQMCGGWGVTLKERPPNELIIEAQKYILNRLSNRWLPRFLATSQFAERQRPVSQMSDVAEDIILQKQKKRGEPWRIMDSKWQSSTRDLVEFRHALANPITASQFRRYVSLKGDFLENDVLFWLEVQKYKDFCHSHNEQSAIDSKVAAIIHCFLDSHIPPSIQIDVPAEIAERIIQKKKDLGPYIFREAQITVLRVLFPYWSGFCAYRKNLTDEKLTTTLERQRARKLERIRQDLNRQQNAQIAKEQATVERELLELEKEKELNQDPLADILSEVGSNSTGTNVIIDRATPSNQIHWSYGKYVEALDRERNLLLMENELKGRIPVERLPKVDEDVSSNEDAISDISDGSGSVTLSITSNSSKTKKRKAKKQVLPNPVSDQKSSNGNPKSSSNSKRGSITNGEKKTAKGKN